MTATMMDRASAEPSTSTSVSFLPCLTCSLDVFLLLLGAFPWSEMVPLFCDSLIGVGISVAGKRVLDRPGAEDRLNEAGQLLICA